MVWFFSCSAFVRHFNSIIRDLIQPIIGDLNPLTWVPVAEWLCTGLQIRGHRFDSGTSLHSVIGRLVEYIDYGVSYDNGPVREYMIPISRACPTLWRYALRRLGSDPLVMLFTIINITLPIFTIALVGLLYGRHTKPDMSAANKLVVDLALPCLVFISLSNKSFDPISATQFTGNAVLIVVLSGLIAYGLARFSGLSDKAFIPCVMFGNVGPVGIPLIALAYGVEAVPFSIVLVVLSNVLHFTVGAGIMGGRIDWKLIYANPLVWATVLGLIFSHFGLQLPEAVDTSVALIADALVPLMLLSLGVRLSGAEFSDVSAGAQSSLMAIVVRLLATYAVLMISPIGALEQGILILFACLPPAIFNFMLADKFSVQPDKVASTVIVGHLISVLALPFGLWLALQ